MITLIDTVRIATIGSPGPQGASAQASSVVVLVDDALSVTVLLGEYALLGDGVAPYPHVILRTEWA